MQLKNIADRDVYLYGNGKEKIIFIHGWPDTHELWHHQVEVLQKDYTCITFTLPSFSKNDNYNYTLDEIIHIIDTIVDEVANKQAINFIVHDWGCIFGYEYAMRFPHKIKSMVGIDIGNANDQEFLNTLSLKAKLMVFAYQTTLALSYLSGNFIGTLINQNMAKALKAKSNIDNIHKGMALPYAMRWFGIGGGFDKLKSFKPSFPYFYAYGNKKPFLFHSESWVQSITSNPKNKVKEYNSGHWVMIDKAHEFNQDVLEWLILIH